MPIRWYEPSYGRYRYCRPYPRVRRHFFADSYYFPRRYHRGFVSFGLTSVYPAYPTYPVYGSEYYGPGVVYNTTYPTRYIYDTNVYDSGVYGPGLETVEPPSEAYVEDQAPWPSDSGAGSYEAQPTAPPAEPEAPPTGEPAEEEAAEPTLVDEGNLAFNAGDYETAVRLYVSAVLTDESDPYARLFYGLAQFALGEYELAAVGIRRALEMESELITFPIDFRSLYPDVQSFEEHLKKLLAYVGEQPKNQNAVFTLGYIYFASADPENAVAFFRTAVEMDPTDNQAVQLRDRAVEIIAAAQQTTEP